MFGHDQSQHHDAVQPAPDGALANDNQGMDLPETPQDPMHISAPGNDTADSAPSFAASTVRSDSNPVSNTASAAAGTDDLLDIKQQALQQLTPLVGHLEQNPEEKFRTTMMMIQAADNSSLIKTAYDAALAISDEKIRAQALLDIVNEINYFTHNNDSDANA